MILLQCDSWSFHTEDPADGRLLHAASPVTLKTPPLQGTLLGGAGDCTRQAVLIEDVERLIESYYDRIQISGQTRQNVAGMMHAQFDQLMATDTQELAGLAADRDRLDRELTAARTELYKEFQKDVAADLPLINVAEWGFITVARDVCMSLASWLTFGAFGPSTASKYSNFFIFERYFSSICLMRSISTSTIMFIVFSRFSEKLRFSRKNG